MKLYEVSQVVLGYCHVLVKEEYYYQRENRECENQIKVSAFQTKLFVFFIKQATASKKKTVTNSVAVFTVVSLPTTKHSNGFTPMFSSVARKSAFYI